MPGLSKSRPSRQRQCNPKGIGRKLSGKSCGDVFDKQDCRLPTGAPLLIVRCI